MLFRNKICGLLAIFFLCAQFLSAQTANIKLSESVLVSNQFTKPLPERNKTNFKEFVSPSLPLSIIPSNYYTANFGIICKKELAFEKATKIPFRFRLGSLQQCNFMEGKR